jgi:hypothetical protein
VIEELPAIWYVLKHPDNAQPISGGTVGQPRTIYLRKYPRPYYLEVSFVNPRDAIVFQQEFNDRAPINDFRIQPPSLTAQVRIDTSSLRKLKRLQETAEQIVEGMGVRAVVEVGQWTYVDAEYHPHDYPTESQRESLRRKLESMDKKAGVVARFVDDTLRLEVARHGPPHSADKFIARVAKILSKS